MSFFHRREDGVKTGSLDTSIAGDALDSKTADFLSVTTSCADIRASFHRIQVKQVLCHASTIGL